MILKTIIISRILPDYYSIQKETFSRSLREIKKQIVQLYETIEDDSRHFNVIKLFGKEINKESFDGYKSDFISEDARYSSARLHNYELYLEVLDKPTKNAVANILKAFIV